MKFLAYVLIALALMFGPAKAQHSNNPLDWIMSGKAFQGLASDRNADADNHQEDAYQARRANNIGFGQNLPGGVNSNDREFGTTSVNNVLAYHDNDRNKRAFTINFHDLRDESAATVVTRDFQGNLIDRTRYSYLGPKANGALTRYRPDLIHDRARITVTVRTSEGPRGRGNGWSARVFAEQSCQTSQRATFAGPSTNELRGMVNASKGNKASKGGRGGNDKAGRNGRGNGGKSKGNNGGKNRE